MDFQKEYLDYINKNKNKKFDHGFGYDYIELGKPYWIEKERCEEYYDEEEFYEYEKNQTNK